MAAALRPIERDWYEATHKGAGAGAEADGTDEAGAEGAGAGAGGGGGGGGGGGAGRLEAWVALVREQLGFVFHAAEPNRLPVPSSRAARVVRRALCAPLTAATPWPTVAATPPCQVRLAAFLDVALATKLLRDQLLHKVLLFVPEERGAAGRDGGGGADGGGADAPPKFDCVAELQQAIEAAIAKLAKHCAPELKAAAKA